MDDLKYEIYQEERLQRFEDICERCGECCGSQDGDPCVNLAKDEATGKYYCKVYENRLGPQRTVSGKIFNCVSINEVMKRGHLRPNCAYNGVHVRGEKAYTEIKIGDFDFKRRHNENR